jgi:putative tricarboxylic transport membrane protein
VAHNSLTVRQLDLTASAFFFALAVFVMFEGARLGAGWDERGPEAGFFPFWLAVVMAFGAVSTFIQGVRSRSTTPFFEERQEIIDLIKVGVPLAVAVIAIPWLGIYVATALYVWLFAWWYGDFRWWTSLLGSACFTGVMFFTLTTMRLPMPMSVLYEKGVLPF